jgi:SAM-dependent methyltransferase
MLTPASLASWFDSPDYQGTAGKTGVGYANYARDERQRALEAMQRYRRDIAPHLPASANVVEVGCASGSLLAEIARHGHRVLGCDLSATFAQAARDRHGIEVRVADWIDLDIAPASLDAILMLGTISNLQRLNESLDAVHRRLKPGGLFFFNFPDVEGLPARLYGARFWMFTPSVAQIMTRRGIGMALDRAGLPLVSCRTDRQAPSVGKIINHARLGAMYPALERLGIVDLVIPFSIPIPGVLSVMARRRP